MAGEINLTVVGNLVADPELRFTPNGAAVCNLTIASNARKYDSASGQWVDEGSTFIRCNMWKQLAENAATSLHKGMRVVATGFFKQRDYEDKNGEKRSIYELHVQEIGASLRYGTTTFASSNAGNQGYNTQQPQPQQQQGGWPNNQQQQQQQGGWGNPAPTGQANQQPPF